MTFMKTLIDHDISDETKKWIEEETAEQEVRFEKIAREMEDLTPTREKWYQEFFDRIRAIGYNVDGDDKMPIPESDLPVKPEGRTSRVVWKYGVDTE